MEQQEYLGKYRLIRKLGQGATSTVYLAHDPFSERDVALKVMKPEILDDSPTGKIHKRMLHAEASLAGRLSHPHLVAIYDAVINEEISYIVMEYVEGGTLEKYAEPDGLLEIPRVVEILFKCCRALNYAQFHGVIHRDIKPANILMSREGEVKISDLGAAIVLDMDMEQTRINNIGSPGYMSPEQVNGETLTHQTDIYSLGVVMYRLLTGRSPYTAKNLMELYQQISNAKIIPPRSLRADLPVALERIMLKAMQRNRQHRYQDWKEFGADLASFGSFEQHDEPVSEAARFTALREITFFENFTDVEIWEILRISEWQQHPEKTALVRENELGEDFFIIIEGMAIATKSGRLLNTIRRGESFGEMAYITGKNTPRSATVTAAKAVVIMKITPYSLSYLSNPCQLHFSHAFLKIMADRLRVSSDRFSHLLC
ncbi:MAG TPA: serine/threonine-protein kinase [Gallionella sp.]|nr:serine/threonine-protein kinase [Gallionella sp.]